MNKESQFIELLGGTSAVARTCEVTRGAVSQWKKSGIPKAQKNYLKTKFPSQYKEVFEEMGCLATNFA